jgi:hypothetical protein
MDWTVAFQPFGDRALLNSTAALHICKFKVENKRKKKRKCQKENEREEEEELQLQSSCNPAAILLKSS